MNNSKTIALKPTLARLTTLLFLLSFTYLLFSSISQKAVDTVSLISPFAGHAQSSTVFSSLLPRLAQIENKYTLNFNSSTTLPLQEDFDMANSYIVVDNESGDVIMEKNAQSEYKIASLTKIMTSIVALDLASPDEEFTITRRAARQIPTKIGVITGEKMTLDELLNAVMLTSANDAAQAVKEGIDSKYGEVVFIKAMNEKAQMLGLSDTSFDNPQGFDGPGNYSSARDLAILSHYALENYPKFAEIVKKDYEFLPENSSHKQFDLYNWNGLIGVYPNTYGIKIGSTENAGKTTIVASEREGRKMLVVLLGAPGILERDLWAAKLLDMGFESAANLAKVNITEADLQAKYNTWEYFN